MLIERKEVNENKELLKKLVYLGIECVKKINKKRNKMEKVIEEMEEVD
jgi:hypothetical protein